MSFGFSLQRWDGCFDDEQLPVVRQLVARVNPSQSWEALLAAKPRPASLSLWSDFGHYWDVVLEHFGVVAPYDEVHLLPVDFAERDPRAPRCVNLRPTARRAWLVVDARWLYRSWRGHAEEEYAHRCRAYAMCFDAWMASLQPGTIEAAIEAFEARRDPHEIVTSYLELALIQAAEAATETRCPVALHW